MRTERDKIYENLYCVLNTADIVRRPIKFSVSTDTEYLLMDSIPSNMNPFHSFTSHFKNYFNISMTPYHRSTK